MHGRAGFPSMRKEPAPRRRRAFARRGPTLVGPYSNEAKAGGVKPRPERLLQRLAGGGHLANQVAVELDDRIGQLGIVQSVGVILAVADYV